MKLTTIQSKTNIKNGDIKITFHYTKNVFHFFIYFFVKVIILGKSIIILPIK